MNRCLTVLCVLSLLITLCIAGPDTRAQEEDRNKPPINYDTAQPDDEVARLVKQLEQGNISLDWNAKHGWLPSILTSLDISRSSQTLVFSKTSQQNRKIRPSSPRAIYFNDNVYVGFVQQGDFLEIAAVDPALGATFYTIDQTRSVKPKITRATHQCMSCHDTHKTQDVPGFLVRSVYPKKTGHPDFRLGTTSTDHTTPLKDRFGGWYVTGEHGDMRHRGNVFVDDKIKGSIDREAGANQQSLPPKSRPDSHLEPTSDIVALMILEHQTQFHNRVTQASYTARQVLHHQAEMNRLFKRDAAYRSDSTKRRLDSAAEELVEYLFFCGEFQLTSPIKGNSRFAKQFEANAIRSARGRSLRDLDLKTRLLKHPCSYLVYTDSFVSLPDSIMSIVKTRMLEILTGADKTEAFAHLSDSDRENILKILTETHPLFRD